MTRLRDTLTAHRHYLAQESCLIIFFGYAILAGGNFNSLVVAPLRLANTVLLALLGALWLTLRLARRQPFPHTPLDLPLLGYLIAFALTAAFSMDPRRSAGAVWRLGLYILLFYLFVDLLRHGWPAELFVKILLVVSAAVLGFAVQHLARWYSGWHAIWGWTRPFPTLTVRVRSIIGHSNWVAAFVNLLWPLALLRLSDAKRWLSRIFLIAWLLIAALVVYFTSSRGGWLGTAAALGTILLLSTTVRHRMRHLIEWLTAQRWRLLIGGLTTLGAGILLAVFLIQQLQHPTHGGILASRGHFWQTAWVAFRSAPLWGTGPLTYGETYMATRSIPPAGLFVHAHSYPINLGAGSGLVGLAAFGWLSIALSHQAWKSWRLSPPEERPIRLGALAALVGCAVHSQFETVDRLPTISLILALEIALLLAPSTPRPERRRLCRWVLPLGWILLLVAALWSLYTTHPFSRGISAAKEGRWEEAASLLDTAAERDPHFAYYQLQAGYVHGVRANDDLDELTKAINHYRVGISRSPNYALNSANLSALLWQAGKTDQALAWMEHAVDQAPQSALLHLNLGRLYEELGQKLSASGHYYATLDNVPSLTESFFWRASPFRTALKETWLETSPELQLVGAPGTPGEWSREGHRSMADGDHHQALQAFQRAVSLDPHYADAYLGQAAALGALGHEDEAERWLRTALLTEGGAELDRVRARFALARLYGQQGKIEEAIRLAEQAIALSADPSVQIPGQLSSVNYAWFLFHSEMIYPGLLPQLTIITVTDEVAEWMLQLGAWHEQAGNPAAAASVYRRLLEEVPDSEAAHCRLVDLKE